MMRLKQTLFAPVMGLMMAFAAPAWADVDINEVTTPGGVEVDAGIDGGCEHGVGVDVVDRQRVEPAVVAHRTTGRLHVRGEQRRETVHAAGDALEAGRTVP